MALADIFTILLLASAAVFVIASILLAIRVVKKKPKKPVAITAAAAILLFIVSFVGIGVTYQPTPEQIAERERIEAEKAAKEAEEPQNTVVSDEQTPEPLVDNANNLSEQQNATTENEQTNDDVPFVEKYKKDIVVAAAMTINNFTQEYNFSLAVQNWTVAPFDDDDAIIATVSAENKSSKQSANIIVVLTPVMNGDEMTESNSHLIWIGNQILYDDGYCDEFFENIDDILDMFK